MGVMWYRDFLGWASQANRWRGVIYTMPVLMGWCCGLDAIRCVIVFFGMETSCTRWAIVPFGVRRIGPREYDVQKHRGLRVAWSWKAGCCCAQSMNGIIIFLAWS